MKRLHEQAEFQKMYKTEQDTLMIKMEKIEIERQMDHKKMEELQRKKEMDRKREFDNRVKDQQFKVKTMRILAD